MNFDEWLKENPYPSYRDLLIQYGRWNLIPPTAWADLDQRQKDWQAKYRNRGQDAQYDHIGKKLGRKF
jgi:hypothetical protein